MSQEVPEGSPLIFMDEKKTVMMVTKDGKAPKTFLPLNIYSEGYEFWVNRGGQWVRAEARDLSYLYGRVFIQKVGKKSRHGMFINPDSSKDDMHGYIKLFSWIIPLTVIGLFVVFLLQSLGVI